jgi:hypothetical protein
MTKKDKVFHRRVGRLTQVCDASTAIFNTLKAVGKCVFVWIAVVAGLNFDPESLSSESMIVTLTEKYYEENPEEQSIRFRVESEPNFTRGYYWLSPLDQPERLIKVYPVYVVEDENLSSLDEILGIFE